jgi:hypothetical protein
MATDGCTVAPLEYTVELSIGPIPTELDPVRYQISVPLIN